MTTKTRVKVEGVASSLQSTMPHVSRPVCPPQHTAWSARLRRVLVRSEQARSSVCAIEELSLQQCGIMNVT